MEGLARLAGDAEAAWREAGAGGCSDLLWLELADRRAAEHPEDALAVWKKQVEPTVAGKNGEAYRQAVALLRKIRGVLLSLGREREFTGYVAALRSTHKRLRNLMKMLDHAAWTSWLEATAGGPPPEVAHRSRLWSMDKPTIDAEELVMALENHSYEMAFFLDRRNGEVFPVFADNAESDDDRARIDANPDDFVAVDPLPSSVGWEVMAAFVEALPPLPARHQLASALNARHPFRAFKDILAAYPALRDDWFAFHDREWTKLAAEWLADEGVDATLTVRRHSATDNGDSHR